MKRKGVIDIVFEGIKDLNRHLIDDVNSVEKNVNFYTLTMNTRMVRSLFRVIIIIEFDPIYYFYVYCYY